jgi:hypothetical protein
MKINLKYDAQKGESEHVRISHDTKGGALRIYIENGIAHITAMPPEDGADTIIVIGGKVRVEQ